MPLKSSPMMDGSEIGVSIVPTMAPPVRAKATGTPWYPRYKKTDTMTISATEC